MTQPEPPLPRGKLIGHMSPSVVSNEKLLEEAMGAHELGAQVRCLQLLARREPIQI